ncbi:protein disulfide-isomerase A5 [Daphnia magna]|uniref:Uncharacterized protein n=2 Tax=Daphnia magna TaxID=35525 RepID=A0ABR0A3Y8_9CRUS|nr:protein disulfide-isomerase A5 [Daphnia magna]KAK4019857.1 hypothetical protein OUZ56_001862 [Daphnia magna]KZS21530.1 Uncharacterized protein APZ42_011462 [Daphnia magna]
MKIAVFFVFCMLFFCCCGKKAGQKSALDEISDLKEFKKLLKTRTSVLVCFTKSLKESSNVIKQLAEVSEAVRGTGTIVTVDCGGEGKKLCKSLKIKPEPYILKHYKDGEYHKDYDRKEMVTSFIAFMKDPTGDAPWEEEDSSQDVFHLANPSSLAKMLRKEEKKGIMVMFYAPWCGYCKKMKPDYAQAAAELKGQAILAAIDVNRPENSVVRKQYNITGFPTLLYFKNGAMQFTYEGDNNRDSIVSFMRNPSKPTEKPKEPEWSEMESDVVHLTTSTFDDFLKSEPSALVMFYAPWCGHCKKIKPEYMAAATKLKEIGVSGKLVAVDAQKESSLGSRFGIRGYPSLKYFKNGEVAFDVSLREEGPIVDFMKDPKEPPPPPPPEKPWSEEPSDVVHLNDENFKPTLKKTKHALVMFYAPWCGHCKRAKPEYTAAAARLKDDYKVVLAAVDCTIQQALCKVYDVKGFPSFIYFNYLKNSRPYSGGRTESEFVSFMEDPDNPKNGLPPAPPSPEEEWAGLDGSKYLHHLTDSNFDEFVKKKDSVLVMFYAPWCGHCKSMKSDYALAAKKMKEMNIAGELVTVDATAQTGLQTRFEIRGFPTIRYFYKGSNLSAYERKRKADDIVDYMRNPPRSKDEL